MLCGLGDETPHAISSSRRDANKRFSVRSRDVDSSTGGGFTISNTPSGVVNEKSQITHSNSEFDAIS
jgi:hypothetical protein